METKLSNELTMLTARLMLANSKREIIELSNDFGTLITKVIEQEKSNYAPKRLMQQKTVTATIKFTKQEVANMAQTLKKEFIANGLVARVIKRQCGKNTFCYEIRYRRNGFNISASSTDLETAKRKFLFMTTSKEIFKHVAKEKTCRNSLESIFKEWHDYKKDTVSEKQIKHYTHMFKNLPDELKYKDIRCIKTNDIKNILNDVQPRTYEELRMLFNGIFKYAIASNIVSHNPVGLILFKRAERTNRDALSEEEIKTFFTRILEPQFESIRQAAYLLYFFGLRPCEVDEETRREGDFLITRNRKRKQGKIEYKKIPIPKQANQYIDWNKPLIFNVQNQRRSFLFRELLNKKTAYFLRHTFATTCQQYVRPDIVDIWMGDSPQRLVGKFYTHFPDSFMKDQMEKVVFIT